MTCKVSLHEVDKKVIVEVKDIQLLKEAMSAYGCTADEKQRLSDDFMSMVDTLNKEIDNWIDSNIDVASRGNLYKNRSVAELKARTHDKFWFEIYPSYVEREWQIKEERFAIVAGLMEDLKSYVKAGNWIDNNFIEKWGSLRAAITLYYGSNLDDEADYDNDRFLSLKDTHHNRNMLLGFLRDFIKKTVNPIDFYSWLENCLWTAAVTRPRGRLTYEHLEKNEVRDTDGTVIGYEERV